MTTERLLQSVGKRTFVNCFEARRNKGRDLSWVDVMNADSLYSEKWKESSLTTKTYCFNRIFRENKELEAFKLCCEGNRPHTVKAWNLCNEYY